MSSEAIVRSALREHLPASVQRQRQDVIDEFWVPPSQERVDVAVIGSLMQAYEIKTARDSLRRLPRQIDAYGRIFDQCTAVVAERHVGPAVMMVPPWWGVLVIRGDEGPTFETVQKPGYNTSVDPSALVRLLWRDEVHSALVNLGSEPSLRVGRVAMWQELLRIAHIDALRAIVRHALLAREPRLARIPSRRFTAVLTTPAGL